MKKLTLIGLCFVLTLGVIGGMYATASTRRHHATRTFTVVRKITGLESQDAVPDTTTAGDRFEFNSDLIRNGDVIGHQGAVCTVVSVRPNGDHALLCSGTFTLPRGSITTQAYHSASGAGGIAITGGTGIYRDARGQVVEGDTLPGDRLELIFELS